MWFLGYESSSKSARHQMYRVAERYQEQRDRLASMIKGHLHMVESPATYFFSSLSP